MWPGLTVMVGEPGVGVHRGAVVVIVGVAVELVSTSHGRVVDLGSGEPPILTGVSIVDYSDFGDLVDTQRQVAGPGVVQVEISIDIITTVQRVQIGGSGQTECGKAAVAAAETEVHTRGRIGNGCDVAARDGQCINLAGIEGGGDIGILRLQHGRGGIHLNR